MGTFLNSRGGLTESQKIQADALGISHEEQKQYIQDRLMEVRGGVAPRVDMRKSNHTSSLDADNPVLVVGHGPSFMDKIEEIRAWKHTIVATDICLKELLDNDIIPEYVVTLESSSHTCALWNFDFDRMAKHKIKALHSSITLNEVKDKARKAGVDIKRFEFAEEPRCSNVGLYSMNFAFHVLKADKIVIIGFEHNGSEYSDFVFKLWTTDFWYFVRKWPKYTVINCSEGGILYFRDYVLESTLKELNVS